MLAAGVDTDTDDVHRGDSGVRISRPKR